MDNTQVGNKKVTQAIANQAVGLSKQLNNCPIVCLTVTGYTAQLISKANPDATILAITHNSSVRNKLSTIKGIHAIYGDEPSSADQTLDLASDYATECNLAKSGDLIVIVGGYPINQRGATNFVKVQLISKPLAKGQGVGDDAIYHRACVVNNAQEANQNMKNKDVLVAKHVTKDYVPAVKKASAIIVEDGGLTSFAAIMGISLGIPVIVGASDATTNIKSGMLLTVDAHRGVAFEGIS